MLNGEINIEDWQLNLKLYVFVYLLSPPEVKSIQAAKLNSDLIICYKENNNSGFIYILWRGQQAELWLSPL